MVIRFSGTSQAPPVPSRQPAKSSAGKTAARKAPARRPSTHEVQAAVEGVTLAEKVTLRGAEFRIADEVGVMGLLIFADLAVKGVSVYNVQALSAMYAVIKGCIYEEEWPRFVQYAIDSGATAEELFGVVTDVIAIVSARPPGSPSASSDGRRRTSQNSKGSSPKTATARPRRSDVPQVPMIPVSELLGG
jgi:hypothetical protein